MTNFAYVLHTHRFEALLAARGMDKADFIQQSGIPHSTFWRAMRAESELSGPTIRYFLEAFPGTSFEYLFYAPKRAQQRVPARVKANAA